MTTTAAPAAPVADAPKPAAPVAEAPKPADPRLGANWGTIVEPPFDLGFQKLPGGVVAEITERLHTTEIKARISHKEAGAQSGGSDGSKSATPEEVEAIVARLSIMKKDPPESKRVGASQTVGILNSYAWKGWKTSDVL